MDFLNVEIVAPVVGDIGSCVTAMLNAASLKAAGEDPFPLKVPTLIKTVTSKC